VRSLLRERFVVTLRSGETFDGLLVDADVKTFRMANASAVDAKGKLIAPVLCRKAGEPELFDPVAGAVVLDQEDGERLARRHGAKLGLCASRGIG